MFESYFKRIDGYNIITYHKFKTDIISYLYWLLCFEDFLIFIKFMNYDLKFGVENNLKLKYEDLLEEKDKVIVNVNFDF